MARLYPDPPTEAERDEMHRIMSGVARNRRDVLLELRASSRIVRNFLRRRDIELPPGLTTADVPIMSVGPKAHQCVAAFARKLITALHYKETFQIITPKGGIAWRWYSNADAIEGTLPDALLNLLGGRSAIQRARRNLTDQFDYMWGGTPDRNMAAYFATFRFSFAIVGVVMQAEKLPEFVPDDHILRPLQEQ